MIKDYKISKPFFEFGPKAYLYGEELLELMKKIDGFAQKNLQFLQMNVEQKR